jgi:formamidopyrimidine-DNA glycosylase
VPELAEVEYVAREMREMVIGATIARVEIAWERAINHPAPDVFIDDVTRRTIAGIQRRGKLLLIQVVREGELRGGTPPGAVSTAGSTGDAADVGWLTVHRRMSGNLRLLAADEPDEPYRVAMFFLADGRRIEYSDPRKFGRLAFWHADELPAALAHFGAEPLDPAFTDAALGAILHDRQRALKPLLLDQSVIAGLGNIYADEALHRAGLHPLRQANTLTPAETARLRAAIVAVLETGIAHGGTTFGRHQGLFGEAGSNVAHLRIYQREGKPCITCGTPIQRIIVAQRGTRFCPRCQPL